MPWAWLATGGTKMGRIQTFDFPEFAYSPCWAGILPRKGDIHGPAPGDTGKGPAQVKCTPGSAPTSTRVSLLPCDQSCRL